MSNNSPSIVVTFLRKVAEVNMHNVYNDLFGSINLTENMPITQSSGAVYGIWAKAPAPLRDGLKPLPDYPEWYPIYWGKDISPVSRMKAHVKGHKNGNINLPEVKEINGKDIIFGAVLVGRYQAFETLLHKKYPPMLGSPKPGKKSTVVRIDDDN